MAGFYTHGPTLTYVTDPSLTLQQQQEVISRFVSCAPNQMLRVAFRLPDAEDADVRELILWYEHLVDQLEMRDVLLPPLIHNRPGLARDFAHLDQWLSAQCDGIAHSKSVHDVDEATRAIAAGAKELIVGHIFASESHPGVPGRGTGLLVELADRFRTDINTPVITAIGGIDSETVANIGKARVFNVAAIRAISRAKDISEVLRNMRRNWVTALIDTDLEGAIPLALAEIGDKAEVDN